jgi:hypothetical protein
MPVRPRSPAPAKPNIRASSSERFRKQKKQNNRQHHHTHILRSSGLSHITAKMLLISGCLASACVSIPVFGQQPDPPVNIAPEPESKRIFGIVPNFRTSPMPVPWQSLAAREKFKIATLDAFDRGTVALAILFAAEGQLTNSNPSFGQGVKGYAHYAVTSYADWVIGDYMTEAIYPAMLHQDPRYFRRGTGSGWSRLRYAAGQVFWTHTDAGRGQFNFSEIAGNSSAVAISIAYYPDNRTAGEAVSKLGTQLGVDMGSNILKEFWPDIERKILHKRR